MEEYLKNKFNKYAETIGEDRILWIAATPGQSCDGLGSPTVEPATACYLPTEKDLYMSTVLVLDEHVIDIRILKNYLDELVLAPYKYLNPKYEDLLINNLFNNKEIFTNDNALYHAIYNIINHSFDVPSNEQELINILTKTEIKILNNILNKFYPANEGFISVNTQSEEWNISTSVFRTLFYKLKEYRVAEIKSKGVKGTFIKFNNFKTLQSLLDKNKD